MIDESKLKYTIEAVAEIIAPHEYFNALSDGKAAQRTQDRLDAGNEWAWCSVRLTCEHKDYPFLEGVTYLGCCSYDSENDFVMNSGYIETMKDEARQCLEDEMINYIRRAGALQEELDWLSEKGDC